MWPLRRGATRFVDPVLRPLAGRLPCSGSSNTGAVPTGRLYRTPVNVFRRGDTFLFFLTYGSDVQWVKNVLVGGGCTIETRGETLKLLNPELIADPKLKLAPPIARLVERQLAGATQYLRMRTAEPGRCDPE